VADITHTAGNTSSIPTPLTTSEAAAEIPLVRAHMPELDAIRGVAILMVLFYHAFYWGMNFTGLPTVERRLLEAMHAGKLGVNLFFVLSGFLITGLLLNAREKPDYYRKFYIRRALRIFPAYLVTLLALAITGTSLQFIGLSLLYLSNFTPLFGVAMAYPVLWSLAVEEHFYLLWPMAVRKLSSRGILAGSAAILVVSPLLRWISFQIEAPKGWVSYQIFDYTWNSADGLACGAFLAECLREFAPDRRTFSKAVAALFVIGLALLPVGIQSKHGALGAALQVVPWNILFVAIIGAGLLAGSRPKKPVRWRLLEFFGEISYGLYLYHLLVFRGFEWLLNNGVIRRLQIDLLLGLSIRFVICGGIAVGIAWLSRRYFEEPFLRLKSRLAP
jgi:peptidoglycan/LPS O-acetylase OafA/YrhL